MAFSQHATDCTDHPNCCAIIGEQDGTIVWISHMDASVPPETRIALDGPDVEDHRA